MAKMVIKMISETEAQVTKAFAKNAVIFGTEEYKLWREYRKDFPDAKMVTKTIKKNPEKKTYRNLTYKNMELFISVQPKKEDENGNVIDYRKEFERQKLMSKVQSNPYKAVLAWFLATFENYSTCSVSIFISIIAYTINGKIRLNSQSCSRKQIPIR